MTKTSKLIAGLAVVAGFGVAVLPLASYAVDTKSVDVQVIITNGMGIETPSGGVSCSDGYLDITPGTIGASLGHKKCDILVSSNVDYQVSISSSTAGSNPSTADNTAALVGPSGATIAAVAQAYTAEDVNGGATTGNNPVNLNSATNWTSNGYGFNVKEGATNRAEDISGFYALPVATTVMKEGNAGSTFDATLTFGATVARTTTSGTYYDIVTITAESR
jgi:hypothetical protein